MATAPKKARAPRNAARAGGRSPASALMEFLVFEDNGGGFGWMIVTAGGEQLARSRSFASHDEAVVAARLVRDDAGSARLEDWQRTAPVDLVARRAAVRDAFDAERWLGERGNARGTLRAADALHE
jgi:uncharacterized protein YegP (UPF0339 family)